MTPATLSNVPAVRLFVQRAQAARPDFALNDRNAAAVADICRRLDGLPLAIELAAVRSKLLPPLALLTRLDRRLSVLTDGPLGLPERQQTLRRAIAWSYDLLEADERLMFRQPSVFSGGCTEAQARALCGPFEEDVDGDLRVLTLLAALVDNSLLRVHEQPDGEPRITMLETLREFGAEQLAVAGESDELRRRHADLFLELATQAQPRLASAGRQQALEQLEADYDNLRAALAWLTNTGRGRGGLRLASAMRWFWHFNGRVTDGRRWLDRALDSPDTVDAGSERAVALVSAGHLAWVQGDYHAARRWLSEGVALARERGDRSALADGLLHLALLVGHDQAQPAGYEEESLAISRDLDDPWLAALALHAVGVGALTRSDGASAHRRLNESLALWLELCDAWFAAHALKRARGSGARRIRRRDCRRRYSRCLELLHQHGIRHGSASVLHNLGYVRHQLGDDRAALPLFREALALFVNQGDHRGIAECLVGLGVCLRLKPRHRRG